MMQPGDCDGAITVVMLQSGTPSLVPRPFDCLGAFGTWGVGSR
jgi:hypothetical protein